MANNELRLKERQLPKPTNGGVVVYPSKIDFGYLKRGGVYKAQLLVAMRPGKLASESIQILPCLHRNIYVVEPHVEAIITLQIQIFATHAGKISSFLSLTTTKQKVQVRVSCEILSPPEFEMKKHLNKTNRDRSKVTRISQSIPSELPISDIYQITIQLKRTPSSQLSSTDQTNTSSKPKSILKQSEPPQTEPPPEPQSQPSEKNQRARVVAFEGEILYEEKATGQNPNIRPVDPKLQQWKEGDNDDSFYNLSELTDAKIRLTPHLPKRSQMVTSPQAEADPDEIDSLEGTGTINFSQLQKATVLDQQKSPTLSTTLSEKTESTTSSRHTPRSPKKSENSNALMLSDDADDDDLDWGSDSGGEEIKPVFDSLKKGQISKQELFKKEIVEDAFPSEDSDIDWGDDPDELLPEEPVNRYISDADFVIEASVAEQMKQNEAIFSEYAKKFGKSDSPDELVNREELAHEMTL
ncbi:hypothetical protein BLNAU_11967 [Blattamonas nauphoetae]|uniref:Uncharacterized protein n=1 Tax=Blattamonas nauphoetae TaxID=2049346 RepID=A0ABQ9XKM4_9EUKA|nr:hypothetical protein BLNAU_11967 [Blattamonas nauphoetae]